MATEKVLSLISEVRGGFIRFLESELAASSANEVQPSYGPVLSALFKYDGKLKMKEIAHAANRDKSTVTYLVNNLVKIGYVKKEPGRQDCRETYVVLTQKAWDSKNTFTVISKHLLQTAYNGFTEEEQLQLTALLTKMNNNFNRSNA